MDRRIRQATALMLDVVRDPDAYPDHFLVFPLQSDIIDAILTHERRHIVQYLRQNGRVDSLKALARALERDEGNLSRDVNVLIDAGLVEAERRGRRKGLAATGKAILLI